MLKDITFDTTSQFYKQFPSKKIADGIYSHSFSFKQFVKEKLDDFPTIAMREKYGLTHFLNYLSSEEYIPEFGICDNYVQILEKYPYIISSPIKYVITVQYHHREDSDIRFHKYGEYIGTQNCKGYEYFKNENEMTHVYLYKIWQVIEE